MFVFVCVCIFFFFSSRRRHTRSIPFSPQGLVVETEMMSDLVNHRAAYLATDAIASMIPPHERAIENSDPVWQGVAKGVATLVERYALVEAEERVAPRVQSEAAEHGRA